MQLGLAMFCARAAGASRNGLLGTKSAVKLANAPGDAEYTMAVGFG